MRKPSVDCILMKARLCFFRRWCTHQWLLMTAVMNTECGGKQLSWEELLQTDFRCFRKRVSTAAPKGDPKSDPIGWVKFAHRQRTPSVGNLLFSDSSVDRDRTVSLGKDTRRLVCKAKFDPCSVCTINSGFESKRMAHSRRAHPAGDQREAQRFHASPTGVGAVCGTDFVGTQARAPLVWTTHETQMLADHSSRSC